MQPKPILWRFWFLVNGNEFEILLNQKLSAKVKTAIRSFNVPNLEDFYNSLMNIYDRDYTKREAFSALMNIKKSYNNLKNFTIKIIIIKSKRHWGAGKNIYSGLWKCNSTKNSRKANWLCWNFWIFKWWKTPTFT